MTLRWMKNSYGALPVGWMSNADPDEARGAHRTARPVGSLRRRCLSPLFPDRPSRPHPASLRETPSEANVSAQCNEVENRNAWERYLNRRVYGMTTPEIPQLPSPRFDLEAAMTWTARAYCGSAAVPIESAVPCFILDIRTQDDDGASTGTASRSGA